MHNLLIIELLNIDKCLLDDSYWLMCLYQSFAQAHKMHGVGTNKIFYAALFLTCAQAIRIASPIKSLLLPPYCAAADLAMLQAARMTLALRVFILNPAITY